MNGTVTFLSLGKMGRFANALFQIAGTIGIARKNNMNFAFPKFINYDHKERFGSSEEIEVYKFFENSLPQVNGQQFQYKWIDWGYHDVQLYSAGNFDLCGHFQSEKYFKHCMAEVRHYMKMKDEYEFMKNVCAVHYRAGDYQDGENVYHPRQTKDYYEKAMSVMPSGTRVLVFSDDTEAAKNIFGTDVRYADGEDYIDDFKAMKACNHFITANSSFSLLPAILSEASDKIVVCPKKWFGSVAGITGDDCYPEKAIVI